ncbi:MAG: glycosyl hydrolase 115 family protein [Lachnospiraceae bacterium]|nr:glycosyl hydrolase 115 family protein [Lachnospiraceae bacterium]
MEFVLNRNNVSSAKVSFLYEEEALVGVKRIADKVRKDLSLVFDVLPQAVTVKQDAGLEDAAGQAVYPVIFGTAGKSHLLSELEEKKLISLDGIRGRREVYTFRVVSVPAKGECTALVIAGSDKRGTIYGLFHLSELLGVSPLVDWCDVMPDKRDTFVISEEDGFTSKEPSVRYRGFFINDEWPAFGNWAGKNFGGFNAAMYEHVFELLLRLKGNYLWPAMWSAVFPEDGPGLKNAELADELGVIMGMSHHEPCLRQGEEYKHLRGPESVYGDAWDFKSNREGIIRFWEDGLKRSGKFENVITVGMRGEFDSILLGKEATLSDNIDLLRDVLRTQNSLIRENVNKDLDKVPRMLALYKEVEPFFYGDEDTKGLMDDPELEGVTLMLCDDNFGNLRTLPDEHMRGHRGGYGMYYHFDYHGWPVSYEWVNSTYLPKVWEQMTTAYEFGIRELWIVNVGDIFTNEYPLSYFMELAYDYDKWGIGNLNSVDEFNAAFVERQFGNSVSLPDRQIIARLLKEYTRISSLRRPEAMNDRVFDATAFGELEDLSFRINELMELTDEVSTRFDEGSSFVFFELVGYPLIATLNLMRMWLAVTENHYLAGIGAGFAQKLAMEARNRLKLDRALTGKLHELKDGKWYGMGLSEHVGFRHWNEEECLFPLLYDVEPANKARLIVTIPGTNLHTEGGPWTGKRLKLDDFTDPSRDSARITLYAAGREDASYEIICDAPWLSFGGGNKGICHAGMYEHIYVKLDRTAINGDNNTVIRIHGEYGDTEIDVSVDTKDHSGLPADTYIFSAGGCGMGYVSIEAAHYAAVNDTDHGRFVELPGHGRTLSAMKAFPVTGYFKPGDDAPGIDYRIWTDKEDEYEVYLYTSPSNPVSAEGKILFGISTEPGDRAGDPEWDGETEIKNTIPDGFKVGDDNDLWGNGVLENIRVSRVRVILAKGMNTLRIFAVTPGFVLEKIVIAVVGTDLSGSYLGPKETYRITAKEQEV